MIKTYTAFTTEIDDCEAAVREICEQLNPEENALKNTIGLVHFYYEFAEVDVCNEIMKALPFDLVGCVSSYIGTGGKYGDVALSVTMITSDDASFSVRTLEGVDAMTQEQISGEITKLFGELCAKENPKLIIPFLTPMQHFSGDELVAVANALPEPVPMFGTVAFNMENKEGTHFVWGNSKISSNMYVFAAFYGAIEPKFHVTTAFAFDESFSDSAEITNAEGPMLKEVNSMTALEYLKKQGMVTSDNSVAGSGIWAVPAILTYPNGTKVVRAFLGIIEGTEYIFATGAMETGAKITFAYLDGDKTLASAEALIKKISADEDNDIISYSCAARAWSLGAQYFAEAQKIANCADEYKNENSKPLRYCVAYSGGEICPVFDNTGKLINALHNYTLIACSFN